jgi:hypothetical protein
LYRPVPHAGLSGAAPGSTDEPTEAATLSYFQTYQKVPRNQGSTEKRWSGKDSGRVHAEGCHSGSVLVQGGLFLGMNFEHFVKPGQLEGHEKIWMDAAELELPLGSIDSSLQAYEFTQHR